MRITLTAFDKNGQLFEQVIDLPRNLLSVQIEASGQRFAMSERDGGMDVRVHDGWIVAELRAANAVVLREGTVAPPKE